MGNKLFGTDGIRGVANVYPMTAEFALKLGLTAGELICTNRRRVAIGRDTRASGEMLETALCAGFISQGVDVVKMGILPTPALTTLTPELGVDMAVMITASHNPAKDNGIKLIAADGDKFSDDVTAKLEAVIFQDEFNLTAEKFGKVSEDVDSITHYISKALSVANGETPLKGLRVVIDCANGVFSEIMPKVFVKLGAGVIAIGNHPDGYNINKDCGSQHVENMVETVKNSKAHLGIAVDGDGDRILICDENGERLDGDQIIAFFGKYFKENNKLKGNAVAATIVSNPALDRYLESLGIHCVRSAVGERYVIEEMRKVGSNVGGEQSGHMVLSDYARTGDSLIAGLVISLGLLQSGKKMSEIFPLFTPMLKVRVDSKFESKDCMISAFEKSDFQNAIKEGEKMVEGKGRVLVRKSGTEPKIQVWVWADDEKLAKEANYLISSVLEKSQGFETSKNVL